MKGATVDRLKAERKFERLRWKLVGRMALEQPKLRVLTNLVSERKS